MMNIIRRLAATVFFAIQAMGPRRVSSVEDMDYRPPAEGSMMRTSVPEIGRDGEN